MGSVRADRAAALLLAATAIVYGARLTYMPPYLAHDEVVYSMSAYSIATTAHDTRGRFLPLFFENNQYWATPITVYTMAPVLKVLPLTEAVIRSVTVAVAVSIVYLTYIVGARLFRRARAALLAAAFLVLAPAFFIHSRLAVDHLYLVPFLLGSIACLFAYLERGDARLLFLATTLQGIGVYAYAGAVIAMPLYFALTCLTVMAGPERPGSCGRCCRSPRGWRCTRRRSATKRRCTTYRACAP
jgi:4-amino-4-deoxy-L-arabinose transferase-like glycosyltransferase